MEQQEAETENVTSEEEREATETVYSEAKEVLSVFWYVLQPGSF